MGGHPSDLSVNAIRIPSTQHPNRPRWASHLLSSVALVLGLSACASMTAPPLPDQKQLLSAPETFATTGPLSTAVVESLLVLFDDPPLRATVTQSISGNLDLQHAQLGLVLSGIESANIDRAALPTLSGNLSAQRGAAGQSSVSPTLDVRWEIDLWGQQSDQRKAARADKAAVALRHDALRASIAAQVMQAWFDAVTAKQLVNLEQQRLRVLRANVENTRASYRAGIGSLDDLSAINRDLAQTQATLALLQGQSNDATRAVELLLGEYPDNDLAIPLRLPRLNKAPAPGIPLDVLTNRPDMRAAWHELLASNNRISVAQKDLLPQITITGQSGRSASDFSGLSSGASIWSLASALTTPLFEAGRRRAEIDASKTRADQASVTYLQTALTAFSEVEHALDQERVLAQRQMRLTQAVQHARSTETTTATRYRSGLVDILDLLSARNAVFDIQSQLLAVRRDRLKNRVALALALGTGV